MANKYNLSDKHMEIILSLGKHSMRMTEVARELDMHRNTVVYHVERIQEITGKDPLNFYDLLELVMFVKAEKGGDDGK